MKLCWMGVFLFMASQGWSWAISPCVDSIDPEKPQTIFTIIATEETEPVAIDVYICNRQIDAVGEESETKNTNEFFVYPSHVILQPKQKRFVRIIWKGGKNVETEKAYRVVAETLPVSIINNKSEETGVNVNVTMGTQCLCSLYVCPKKAKENIQYLSGHLEKKEDQLFWNMNIKNTGTKHGFLDQYKLQLKSADKKIIIDGNQIAQAAQMKQNILPDHSRQISIPISEPLATEKEIEAEWIYEPTPK